MAAAGSASGSAKSSVAPGQEVLRGTVFAPGYGTIIGAIIGGGLGSVGGGLITEKWPEVKKYIKERAHENQKEIGELSKHGIGPY